MLPGNFFYVRAFIKSYSEAVGLDPNEVLQMYQNVIPNPAPQSTAAAAEVMLRSRSTNKKAERGGKWASTFLMIAFVVLIIGIVYYFVSVYSKPRNSVLPEDGNQITTRKDPGEAKPGTPAPAPAPSAATTPTPPAGAPKKEEPIVPAPAPAPAAAAEVKQTDNVRETYTYTITNTGKLTIQMKVTGDSCWFQLDSVANGRKPIEQGTVKMGDPDKTWEVEGSAFLNVGKANAVQITVNGTPLNMGESPNPRRFQLNLQ